MEERSIFEKKFLLLVQKKWEFLLINIFLVAPPLCRIEQKVYEWPQAGGRIEDEGV